MTYVVGWKTDKNVFISADTAVTTKAPNPKLYSEFSSFGEKHFVNGDKKIEESMLKLFNINDRIIIGFSGHVKTALDVIRNFKILVENVEITKLDIIEEKLRIAVKSLQPLPKDKEFGLILGFIENKEPHLLSYNSDGTHCIQKHERWVCQEILRETIYSGITEMFTNLFRRGNLSDENFLIAVNSIIQSYGIHNNLLENGVGGIIVGFQISKDGVKWQKDTSYIIYNPKFVGTVLINMAIRDGGLAVSSPSLKSKSVFLNTISSPDVKQWTKLWLNVIFDMLSSCKSSYYVFLSSFQMIITIVRAESNNNSDLFFLKIIDETKLEFGASPKLMKKLMTSAIHRGDRSIPFAFNFL